MARKSSSPAPVVGIIMGSQSDWETMIHAADTLKGLGISFETEVVSAHRTPLKLKDYALTAKQRGLKIIIAGAGGAAHLPGMAAAMTVLPVMGVPVQSKSLDGIDSLLAIVQMPAGVPVATMAINGARNAGLFALRILGSTDAKIRRKMNDYQASIAADSRASTRRLVKAVSKTGKTIKSKKA